MDLRTTYLGLELAHPIVASASPLSSTLDGIRRLEDAGAAAIVLFSLFEEQIRQDNLAAAHLMQLGSECFAESLSYFPAADYHAGPDSYLDLIGRARQAVDVPVIASLNGVTPGGWTDYARQMAQAGASAIELNIFFVPADVRTAARDVEQRHLEIVSDVAAAVSVPVAVKLSPFFSAMGEMARRLVEVGAAGLVLFNRFYQPDIDLDRLEFVPSLDLSAPAEIRLPLLWIAVLRDRVPASLAATTGVDTAVEVVKYLLAGADVVMTASALLRHGVDRLGQLKSGLSDWLESRQYQSVRQMQGSMSQQNIADPAALERANYLRVLHSYRNPFLA
jgi:dihydroorotate dehydrogenase (fumarate)